MGSFFLTLEFQKAHLLVHWKRWLDLRSQVMSSVLPLCPLVGFPPRQLSLYDASRSYSLNLSNLQTGKTRACFWQQSSFAFLSLCADYWDIPCGWRDTKWHAFPRAGRIGGCWRTRNMGGKLTCVLWSKKRRGIIFKRKIMLPLPEQKPEIASVEEDRVNKGFVMP